MDVERSSDGMPTRQKARLVGIAVLLVVTVALIADNTHEVRVGWVVDDGRVSLVVLILVVLVIGVAIGWLGARRRD